jgi:FtsP/CotA-like multicopper oxidase with cupredoxin domain
MTPATRAANASLLCAAVGCLTACESSNDDFGSFREPDEIASANGELRATFTVAEHTVEVANRRVRTIVYNGEWMPPLLRVRPGDTIYLDLINQSGEPTNEHYHGLNVSPRINPDATVSDNVLIRVEPGTQVSYRVSVPADHNPGLYWYHSHLHGISESQVMGGLSGGLIVDGVLDPFPELAGIRERVMLLKDIQITRDGFLPDNIDPGGETNRTINGLTEPTIELPSGELQFWRFANIGADMYYRLVLDGHVFYELARDGNRHNQLIEMSEILLPPGARSEVLVRGRDEMGDHTLRTLAFDTGPVGDSYTEATLAHVITRNRASVSLPLPTALPVVEDLRTLPIIRQRTVTFLDGPGNIFYMDSGAGPMQFDPNRVDSTITAGTVEEWTVLNASGELHAFHIHQIDFQVTEIDGVPQPFVGHQDTVNVPYQQDGGPPGQVKLIMDFRNPNIVGKFVYHCHILEHEDGGMMSIAEVVSPPGAPPLDLAAGADANADVVAGTLAAFQAGSYCTVERPSERVAAGEKLTSTFRIERLAERSLQ